MKNITKLAELYVSNFYKIPSVTKFLPYHIYKTFETTIFKPNCKKKCTLQNKLIPHHKKELELFLSNNSIDDENKEEFLAKLMTEFKRRKDTEIDFSKFYDQNGRDPHNYGFNR